MYTQTDLKSLILEAKERNRFFRALQEVQEIAQNINENNFKAKAETIAAKSKEALKRRSNKLSDKTEQFLKYYEAYIASEYENESGDESNERFQD